MVVMEVTSIELSNADADFKGRQYGNIRNNYFCMFTRVQKLNKPLYRVENSLVFHYRLVGKKLN